MVINISKLSYIPMMTCLYDIFEAGVSLTKEMALQFVKNQTPGICLAALLKGKTASQFVKVHNQEIDLLISLGEK